uniref:Uncharacterized protein n=1 Tax=Arundo donax TaxID=35708 RepID=A0A0A9BHX9_ARUDO
MYHDITYSHVEIGKKEKNKSHHIFT